MKNNVAAIALIAAFTALSALAKEATPDAINRIMDEGFNRSELPQIAAYLTDRIGGRMTNSPQMRQAEAWTQEQYRAWGLKDVHLEGFEFGRGWSIERAGVRMVTPRVKVLRSIPIAWTPPTDGALTAPVVLAPMRRERDFDKWKGTLRGKIVLVGATAAGLMDLRATPLDTAIPGVEVHQQVIEQILGGGLLVRPDFAAAIEWLIGILSILVLAFVAPRAQASVSAALGLAIVCALVAAGAALFATVGYLFDPVFPASSAFVFAASSATYFYRRAELQRAEIRRAFSQYVAPSIVRELTAHPERLKLGGEVRDLTLLVCDIRNFTGIAEKLSAEEITAFINSFLTPLTDLIIESGGTIDKYMGDSIMAFWNAPTDDPDHARHACEVALRMGEEMRRLSVKWRTEAEEAGRAFEDVAIGIAVNSGECCVGNLGSDRHFDYSAIGDPVNVTARLQDLTKAYGLTLLVGEETVRRSPGFLFVEVDLVRLRGRQAPSRVFTLLLEGAAPTREHERFLDAYRGARWAEARTLLSGLRQSCDGSLAQLYEAYELRLERLAHVRAEDWDGVYELEHK